MNDEKQASILPKIYSDPRGLVAQQNSIILPPEYIPYNLALLEVEKQKFPNVLLDSLPDSRLQMDAIRIHKNDEYCRVVKVDKTIREAEKKRQEAREYLNQSIIEGEIQSYLLLVSKEMKGLLEFEELESNWWRTKLPMMIDGIGYLWLKEGTIFSTKGIVLLDKKDLIRWGKGEKKSPKGRKRGSGGIDDRKRLLYMKEMISKGASVHRAAQIAVSEYEVSGNSRDSDIRRLLRKFKVSKSK